MKTDFLSVVGFRSAFALAPQTVLTVTKLYSAVVSVLAVTITYNSARLGIIVSIPLVVQIGLKPLQENI